MVLQLHPDTHPKAYVILAAIANVAAEQRCQVKVTLAGKQQDAVDIDRDHFVKGAAFESFLTALDQQLGPGYAIYRELRHIHVAFEDA